MHPEAITNVDRTVFLTQIFSKIKKNLNKKGVVSMQCCSEFDGETIKLLKRILPKYFKNIVYKTSFIPSFCENWVFASAEAR
jgi:spermidine synthase